MNGVHQLHGALGSPYSIKMRAVLRYRRIPHVWRQLTGDEATRGLFEKVKAPVIPVLEFPDGTMMNDSTPLIYELERRHPERSVVPDDPVQAFFARVLEDMADEWGTKIMFHYRWFRPRDQETVSRWLSFDRLAGRGRHEIEGAARVFRDRQVGRMALVGCTPENAPVIEASGSRLFAALDAHVTEEPYLFGSQPSLADFAWLGQFSQLASDPTSADRMREQAPYLMRWLVGLDDASGVSGHWRDPRAALSAGLESLLRLAGEYYFPFMLANAAAVREGRETFTVEMPEGPYSQGVFRYQVRCLQEVRGAYAALPDGAKATVDGVAETHGFADALRAP